MSRSCSASLTAASEAGGGLTGDAGARCSARRRAAIASSTDAIAQLLGWVLRENLAAVADRLLRPRRCSRREQSSCRLIVIVVPERHHVGRQLAEIARVLVDDAAGRDPAVGMDDHRA